MNVEHPQLNKRQFAVQTDVYSGPLDLLIDLIERRKLLINDISLATVTDDYLAYVARLEENPLNEMAEFIVLASTLLLLKSKSLLPILEFTDAEEESIELLEIRLRLYQIFRNAGKTVERIFDVSPNYERRFVPDPNPLFLTDKFTEVNALASSIRNVIDNLPKKIDKPKVQVRKVISLEEMMERLKDRIERQLSFKFTDFAGGNTERVTVIVGFLAVLEMVKQGMVLVRQSATFTDIEIERRTTNMPHYG